MCVQTRTRWAAFQQLQERPLWRRGKTEMLNSLSAFCIDIHQRAVAHQCYSSMLRPRNGHRRRRRFPATIRVASSILLFFTDGNCLNARDRRQINVDWTWSLLSFIVYSLWVDWNNPSVAGFVHKHSLSNAIFFCLLSVFPFSFRVELYHSLSLQKQLKRNIITAGRWQLWTFIKRLFCSNAGFHCLEAYKLVWISLQFYPRITNCLSFAKNFSSLLKKYSFFCVYKNRTNTLQQSFWEFTSLYVPHISLLLTTSSSENC